MTTQGFQITAPPSFNPKKWNWERMPSWTDPRLPVLGILGCYILLGITVLGFNRSPAQILLIIGSACGLDVLFHWLFRGRKLLFPLSAAITGCSLSILTNFSHGMWVPLVPVFFAIASKYLILFKGRHVFNPALFGIVMSLLLAKGAISVSPAYQWGGSMAMVAFIVTAALLLFALKIKRTPLIVSFLILYALQSALRAYMMRDLVPPETIFLGTFTAPAFYLFAFFMITDPATSPRSRASQIGMSLTIVALDLFLHKYETLSTIFYAGFIYFGLRFIRLWLTEIWQGGVSRYKSARRSQQQIGRQNQPGLSPRRAFSSRTKRRLFLGIGLRRRLFLPAMQGIYRWTVISIIGLGGLLFYQTVIVARDAVKPDFQLVEIAADAAGMTARPGSLLEQVDPRIQHVGKWLLSVGDAVAVADADNDGLQDIFLTYPLKDGRDRAALYLNQGDFQFERFPLPVLDSLVTNPEQQGIASDALWFDYDNDSDADLFLAVGYGNSRLLQNRLVETGQLDFVEVSTTAGIEDYTVSVTANALDANRDGKLDLFVGNAMNTHLPDYDRPTRFNIFQLPEPEHSDDRRMFNFMHRTWHDADNGGENLFYLNQGDRFQKQEIDDWGLAGNRWTLDIGTGDVNGDSWTDLYLANDFGPDQLYLNQQGKEFTLVRGTLVGELSRDTYKGMNASLGDVDNNGKLDIYVSNVHQSLQAEGSLLWMNRGDVERDRARAFKDEATQRNALNENRFGWGGAMGDLDRDGKLDILQANGMVDDSYDRHMRGKTQAKPGAILPARTFSHPISQASCPDFWYWNAQIGLTNPDIHGYADRWADLRGRCIFPYQKNRVYLNRGKQFIDVAEQVGWTEKTNSRGIALADLDNDGDLDVLVTHLFAPVSIYRNDATAKSWLGLQLIGNGDRCNRDAVGTRVIVKSKTGQQLREVQASNGLSAQGDRRLLFGLGDARGKVSVDVYWCGSATPQTLHLNPNRYHSIQQS